MALQPKDLMIRDWVKVKNTQKQVKVKEIKQSCIYTEGNGYEYNEIEFIPLTAEILEKNGFIEDDNDDCWGDANCFFIPNYVDKNIISWETHIEPDNGNGDFSGNLTYVHELQHALRLCKVEKTIEL